MKVILRQADFGLDADSVVEKPGDGDQEGILEPGIAFGNPLPIQLLLRLFTYATKLTNGQVEAENPRRPATPGPQNEQVVAHFRKMKRITGGTLIARLVRPVRIQRAPRIPKAGM
ncbi:MAG: hypothetical protein GX414_09810 [Acidobacteria bacterium]|nr:hypothetical protein [Acidobacteriota bacterium]